MPPNWENCRHPSSERETVYYGQLKPLLLRKTSSFAASDGLWDIIIALTKTLVSADLGVLALALLHKRLQLGIVRFSDSLGLHLHHQLTTRGLDARPDVNNGLLESRDACTLV